jgi:hypothetical protein
MRDGPTELNGAIVSDSIDDFPRVMRGYEPAAVNRTVSKLRRELLTAKTVTDEQSAVIADLTIRVDSLETDLREVGDPTYAGLGAKLESTLRNAEEQAARLISKAETDSFNIRANVEREIEIMYDEATATAQLIVEEAERQAAGLILDAETKASSIMSQAQATSEVLVKEAEHDAAELRGQIATEVANARSTARREIDEQVAEAQRQIAELRLVFIKEEGANIEAKRGEKPTLREVVAILRLETEKSVAADNAEKQYLKKHQEAVMLTQKYLDAAKDQLAKARARTADKKLEADAIEMLAQKEARELRLRTDKHIKKILEDAKKTSVALVETADKQSREAIAAAEARVADLRVEREAIGSYLEDLRSLVAQASTIWDTSAKPQTRSRRKPVAEPESE